MLQSRYLEGLTDGRVGAAMCMTEPHCGSDVGLIRTRAEIAEDGTYRLSGTKIFISGGDQDLTQDIVLLVLARLTGAPPGSKGLSLFLAPKLLHEPNGQTRRNRLFATGIEDKMGYSGSATCTMAFDGAIAWLVGEPGRGLNVMFTMINAARLLVGGQGLACAEAAMQMASAYALERRQGRAPEGAREPNDPADRIIVHPDVRKLLLQARAFTESARPALLDTALRGVTANAGLDKEKREEAMAWVSLMTPLLKAVVSDLGAQTCIDCMQVFGGHGYIRSTGIEQYVRDVRLSQIQEGANGMLATDLIVRQLLKSDRRAYRQFLDEGRSTAEQCMQSDNIQKIGTLLLKALDNLESTTAWLLERSAQSLPEAGAAGTEYQRLFGLTVLGWWWARVAVVVDRRATMSAHESDFYRNKLLTARFFFARVLPQSEGLISTIRAGGASILEPPEEYFCVRQ
jgi:alkylation response protein AidB-like acyl-CoA dehydrogenase